MGQKAVEAHLIRAGGKVFSRLVAWLAALLLLFPVGFIAPNAPLGSSSKLGLGPATERLVAAVEVALAAWSVAKLTLGSAAKWLVAAVKAALAAWSVAKLTLGSAAKWLFAVTRRAAIGIEFASGTTSIAVAVAAERLVAAVKAALAAWSIAKLALGSAVKRLVSVARRAAIKAALAACVTIRFFKSGRGGVAVRAIGARAREGKLSAAVGSAFL